MDYVAIIMKCLPFNIASPALLYAAVLLTGILPVQGMALSSCCPDCTISIHSADNTDHALLCETVKEGLAFLSENGLSPEQPITVRIVRQLPGNGSKHIVGQYEIKTQTIYMHDYAVVRDISMASPQTPFGIVMTPELWRSYLVHELAHAVSEHHFSATANTFTASEYIAAVAQLATLPEAIRAEVLGHYQGITAFEQRTEITSLYFYMDPCRFAVKAWLHYIVPGHGRAFIQQLLRDGLPENGY